MISLAAVEPTTRSRPLEEQTDSISDSGRKNGNPRTKDGGGGPAESGDRAKGGQQANKALVSSLKERSNSSKNKMAAGKEGDGGSAEIVHMTSCCSIFGTFQGR